MLAERCFMMFSYHDVRLPMADPIYVSIYIYYTGILHVYYAYYIGLVQGLLYRIIFPLAGRL
jgi:hypothetical protein